jgi:CDP-diacylglycerol--glycerol-3-phosphate 3-phosphatidyltransferase
MHMKLRSALTVPNLLTLIRLLAIPVLFCLILSGEKNRLVAFVLFAAIWLTDFLDGYIARHFNQISEFGKLFDPFVDKLFQLATAVAMYRVGVLPFWVPLFIFIREMVMILGSLLIFQKQEVVVFAKWYGKVATGLFVLAFAILFFLKPGQTAVAGWIFVLPAAASLYAYIRYGLSFIALWKANKSKPGE